MVVHPNTGFGFVACRRGGGQAVLTDGSRPQGLALRFTVSVFVEVLVSGIMRIHMSTRMLAWGMPFCRAMTPGYPAEAPRGAGSRGAGAGGALARGRCRLPLHALAGQTH